LAAAERIGRGDLGRILRLTLLAPDIVEKILEGKQLPEFGPPTLMEPFPACWEEQGSAGAAPYAGTRCGWPAITADTPSAAAGLLLTWRAKSSNPLTSTLPPRSPADG
jgi:hypothetical protein